jgi:hypothetical protein
MVFSLPVTHLLNRIQNPGIYSSVKATAGSPSDKGMNSKAMSVRNELNVSLRDACGFPVNT